jgi:hypothetical protein
MNCVKMLNLFMHIFPTLIFIEIEIESCVVTRLDTIEASFIHICHISHDIRPHKNRDFKKI